MFNLVSDFSSKTKITWKNFIICYMHLLHILCIARLNKFLFMFSLIICWVFSDSKLLNMWWSIVDWGFDLIFYGNECGLNEWFLIKVLVILSDWSALRFYDKIFPELYEKGILIYSETYILDAGSIPGMRLFLFVSLYLSVIFFCKLWYLVESKIFSLKSKVQLKTWFYYFHIA